MASEQEPSPTPFSQIQVVFERADHTALVRRLTPDHPLSQFLISSLLTERSVEQLTSSGRDDVVAEPAADFPTSEANAASPTKQKNPSVILAGKLKTTPKEGRPDSQGHKTAWARLAAHDEEAEGARLVSATFHRGSARIALGLTAEAQVVCEGYLHPAAEPGRLETFSVFRFIQWPGKSVKVD